MPLFQQNERVNNQPAFILHRRSFRDTSLIIDIFCKDYGRLSLVAKGAMSTRSKLKGILQAFQPLTISWVRKSELGTLSNAETSLPPFRLKEESLYSAFYVNEIFLKLVSRDDPHPELFSLYLETIESLQDPEKIECSLRHFEKELLHALGYEIDMFHDADSRELISENSYYKLICDHGFIKSSTNPDSELIFSGEHILNFANNILIDKHSLKTARIIMQACIRRLLGNSEIKSRELYKAFIKSK